jgi:hypothetical protein
MFGSIRQNRIKNHVVFKLLNTSSSGQSKIIIRLCVLCTERLDKKTMDVIAGQ